MDIKTDIEKQISAGFSKEEIYNNLLAKGFSQQEIDANYINVSNDPRIVQRHGSVSPKSIALGILFLLVMVWRLSKLQNGGGGTIFLIIGVITAFILAMLYFTRRT